MGTGTQSRLIVLAGADLGSFFREIDFCHGLLDTYESSKQPPDYAFSNALYYPFIDIRDSGWLRTAALYWSKIQTIVPDEIRAPYSSRFARALQAEEVLVPLRVNPDMNEVRLLTDDVLRYLDDPETVEMRYVGASGAGRRIHANKLPSLFQPLVQLFTGNIARIHREKLHWELRAMIENIGFSGISRDGWLEVDQRFADFYMTLLATRLSRRTGAGLLTPSARSHKVSLSARTDASMAGLIRGMKRNLYSNYPSERRIPASLVQGMLVDLTIEQIAIDPTTSLKKIMTFRKTHKDELGRFRNEISSLATRVPTDVPIDHARQAVQDIHANNVAPAIDALKRSLEGSRIKWLTNGFMRVGFLSAGPSSALVGMGLGLPNALLVGAGVALTAMGIFYDADRREALLDNPYAYLLAIERDLK